MRKRVSKILAAAEPKGDVEAVRLLVKEAHTQGAHAIALLGSLTAWDADPNEYGEVLKAVSEPRLPVFCVPGPEDAPFSEFLREAANIEVVYPDTHNVHATFAMASGQLLISGMGGAIEDDANMRRDELERLRYPGWELEYRLKFLRELKDYLKIFLFTTPPAHKSLHEKGSAVVAEVIKTYRPQIVLVGGREQKHEMLGTSLVVMLGSLAEGQFTLVDLSKREIVTRNLNQSVTAA
jgi:Icc-related predicted phosphoesterase